MRRTSCLQAALIASAFLIQAGAASAASCASEQIEARGEQSRFLWLAKTKARANWRRKVRTNPALGAA
ncbi:MAG: hypothetical protein ABL907_10995, partial [Hyphomicrobium sp.]